jgi:hypothetical protein
LLVGSAVAVGSVSAQQVVDDSQAYEIECSGWYESLWYQFLSSPGNEAPQASSCVEPIELETPKTDDEAWNKADAQRMYLPGRINTEMDLANSVSDEYKVEAISQYRNALIEDDATETEARTEAEEAIYGEAHNVTNRLATFNNNRVAQAKRILNSSYTTYVASSQKIPSYHCGIVDDQSSQTVEVRNATLDYPSSSSFEPNQRDYWFIDYSASISAYIPGSDTADCDQYRQNYDPTTVSPSGRISLIKSESVNTVNTGGDSLYAAGRYTEDAKGNFEVGSWSSVPFDGVLSEHDTALSNALSEVQNFRNSTTPSEIKDGDVVMSPFELARQADGSADAFSTQLLALSNKSAMPDFHGGNLSDVRIQGYDGAASDDYRVNDSIVAPTPDLTRSINGSWSEGQRVNLSENPGGVYVRDPSAGTTEYVDTGTVTLEQSPSPSGTSEFDTFSLTGSEPSRTLERYEELHRVTENASEIQASYASSGFLPDDLNNPVVILILVALGAGFLLFSRGDS